MESTNGRDRPQRVNALGAFIAQRLSELKISRSAFAEQVGMSRSTLYRLLGPDAPERIDDHRLEAMARLLLVEVDQLQALWSGTIWSGASADREELVRSFVFATGNLSVEELRAALEVARAAAEMLDRHRAPGNGE